MNMNQSDILTTLKALLGLIFSAIAFIFIFYFAYELINTVYLSFRSSNSALIAVCVIIGCVTYIYYRKK